MNGEHRAATPMSDSSPAKNFVALGIVVSSTPRVALLAVLQQLRPQFEIRLQETADDAGAGVRYRVEIDLMGNTEAPHAIDLWQRIKCALMAEFPADKPGAVVALDP
jgi:hypothetical protein